jgi:hypothetical protein
MRPDKVDMNELIQSKRIILNLTDVGIDPKNASVNPSANALVNELFALVNTSGSFLPDHMAILPGSNRGYLDLKPG